MAPDILADLDIFRKFWRFSNVKCDIGLNELLTLFLQDLGVDTWSERVRRFFFRVSISSRRERNKTQNANRMHNAAQQKCASNAIGSGGIRFVTEKKNEMPL
ncbi:hypothetical protein RP20_CCG024338 [Aedes albopictus]|nr:hypothetical protein RP20_CCG024338 [Aedes albopictus]